MKISVFHDMQTCSILVLAADKTASGHVNYTIGEGGDLVGRQCEAFARLEPLLRLPGGDEGMQILTSFANALAAMGVIADQTDTRRELSATKAHLADMRTMALKGFDVALARGG